MAREIERKFVFIGDLSAIQIAGKISETKTILQGYYSDPADSMAVRVRWQSTVTGSEAYKEGFLTIKKSDGGPGLIEHEVSIPVAMAEEMIDECGTKTVNKIRYVVPLDNGLKAEIDCFTQKMTGVYIVEIEIPSENFVFSIPDFCGAELTGIHGISNFNMALNPDKVKGILKEYFK